MIFTPRPHQIEMLDWLLGRDRSALFAEPGLGKTAVVLQALDRWFADGEARAALVVAPKRVCSITWRDQVAQWDHSKWMRIADLRTAEGIDAWRRGGADIYLVNPEMLQTRVPLMFKGAVPADVLVIDESSLAKNPSGKRFAMLKPHLPHFTKRIGLTGTPVPNTYLDLFNQIRLLDDGERLGRAFTHFRNTHFVSDYMGWKWTIRDGSKELVDAKLADLALVMLGADHLDIPPVHTEDVVVTLPDDAAKAYKRLEKELLIHIAGGEIAALSAAALCTKLLQLTGGMVFDSDGMVRELHRRKIDALLKLRKDHTGPLLVLTAYTHEMERVLASVPKAERFDERHMDRWRAGKIETWVANPQSMSHGIDGLQESCHTAVWMTPTWSNEGYRQTNARLARTGQTHETRIVRILAKDTIDEAVVEALRMKEDTQGGLMNALKALQMLRK